MTTIRWYASTVFFACMVALSIVPRGWGSAVIAALAAVMFLVAAVGFGAGAIFTRTYWVNDIDPTVPTEAWDEMSIDHQTGHTAHTRQDTHK